MEKCRLPLLLLWLTTVFVMNVINAAVEGAEDDELLVKNLNNKLLKVIPRNENDTNVKKLVIEGNLITLNNEDQQALASYPTLVELYLDSNLVTAIPAKFFSVLPKLRVLSLARNNISSLNPEAFSGLNNLTALDLSCNLLTSLNAQTFKRLNSLQTLNLHGNPWNCSCALLRPIGEINATNVSIGGATVTCASPAKQAGKNLLEATALCSSSPASTQPPSNSSHSPDSGSSSTLLTTTLSSSQNNSISKDQTPVLGNTWKFTSSIIALALTTSMLILCAIKGPSWYKLFHNYRHRLLREDDREDDLFSEAGAYPTHQTFTFRQQNGQTEEEEVDQDGYFEDPYIKSEE